MKKLIAVVKYILSIFKGTAHFEDRGDTGCVCVGLEYSSKYGSCPGAGIDSTRMNKILSKYGRTVLLQDKAATVSQVKSALEEVVKKPLAIFFYSGHGGRVRNPKAQDGSGYSEHLCLNNGALYDYAIWDVISKAKGRVVLIFDCCHSATMFRSATDTYSFNRGFPFTMLKTVATAQGKTDILVWSGCPSDNYSYGSSEGGWLTNGILSGYGKNKTYDEVWKTAEKKAADQHPIRTILGEGFDGKVFR